MCCSIISDLVLIMRTLNVASSWCNVFVSSSNVAATFCGQSVFWCMSWRELCWGISRVHCSSCFYCGAYSGHSARWRSWRRRSRGWRRSWSASRPRRLRPTKRAPASRRWPRKLARCGSRSGHFHWSLKVNWEQPKQTAPAACQKPVNRCIVGWVPCATENTAETFPNAGDIFLTAKLKSIWRVWSMQSERPNLTRDIHLPRFLLSEQMPSPRRPVG